MDIRDKAMISKLMIRLINEYQTMEGGMAKIGLGLDTKDIFPALRFQLISGEMIGLPEHTADGYGVFLVYRGHW